MRRSSPRGTYAYLSGAGVELMANSDNVLRGGLTSKHVDVAELLRVLDFTPHAAGPAWSAGGRMVAVRHRRGGVPPASLRESGRGRRRRPRRRAADPALHGGLGAGARGRRQLPLAGGAERVLGRGQALWLAAGDRHVTIATQEPGTQLFLAGDGLDI